MYSILCANRMYRIVYYTLTMKSSLFSRLPTTVRRSMVKLGRDIAVARRKRQLTTAMMSERLGVTRVTYLKVERGDPTTGLGVYAMAFFVLGLGTPFSEILDVSRDNQGLILDVERLPERVRRKKVPTES